MRITSRISGGGGRRRARPRAAPPLASRLAISTTLASVCDGSSARCSATKNRFTFRSRRLSPIWSVLDFDEGVVAALGPRRSASCAPSGPVNVRVRGVVVTCVRPSRERTHPRRRARRRAECGCDRNDAWSGNVRGPLVEHVLHPLGLLEWLGGIAVELDADRPLPRRRRIAASPCRCRPPAPSRSRRRCARPRACWRRCGPSPVSIGWPRLPVAHRHRVDDVLARVRRDRIGRDGEQIRLAALADLRTARRPAVGADHERAPSVRRQQHAARRRAHDW